MKRLLTIAMVSLLAACAAPTPTAIRLSDPSHRTINGKTAWTDRGTVNNCVSNMINSAPADEATDIQSTYTGSGKTMVVDVNAKLLMSGLFGSTRPVGFRCEYRNGILAKQYWTFGLGTHRQ